MSEYQYIDFVAVDGPVSDKNLQYMEKQSSRAEITPWRFTNEYNFGDFGGNAKEMLRRGYDVHLHFANFGIRKLMIHLPAGLPCDKRTFGKYVIEDFITWDKDKRGKGGVLTIYPEADADTYDYLEDVESLLDRLSPLREMLTGGDLRPLFLAWLACCYEDDAKVPSIPAGLNDLPDPLKALAEFYEIPDALIRAATQDSPPAPSTVDRKLRIQSWLSKHKKADLQSLVTQFLTDDPTAVRSAILAKIRAAQKTPPWPTVKSKSTFGDLRPT